MFFSSIKEINRLFSKGISNIKVVLLPSKKTVLFDSMQVL